MKKRLVFLAVVTTILFCDSLAWVALSPYISEYISTRSRGVVNTDTKKEVPDIPSGATRLSVPPSYEGVSLSSIDLDSLDGRKIRVYLYAPQQKVWTISPESAYGFANGGDKIATGLYQLAVTQVTQNAVKPLSSVLVGIHDFNLNSPLSNGTLHALKLGTDGAENGVAFYIYGSSNTDVIVVYHLSGDILSLAHFVSKEGKREDSTETGLGAALERNANGTFTSQWYDNERGYITTNWKYTNIDNAFHEVSSTVSTQP